MSDANSDNERTKKNAVKNLGGEAIKAVLPSHLDIYFKRDTELGTHGDKYHWVSQFLNRTTTEAAGKILEKGTV